MQLSDIKCTVPHKCMCYSITQRLLCHTQGYSVTQCCFVTHCTMDQALKKIGIKDFAKNYYLGFHFLKPELFQMKIFGCYLLCSFTFNKFLGMSWKQISAAVKLPKNQLRFKQAGNQFEGTS